MKWQKFLKNGAEESNDLLTLKKGLLYTIIIYVFAGGGNLGDFGLQDEKY